MICPQCRSADCYRSRRVGALDFMATVVGLRPWRCHSCDLRFRAWRVAVLFAGYAHCPRCGNFDLEHVPRERVARGILKSLLRFLGLPAYRCNPCREKFFSLRPYRRIIPSMLSAVEQKSAS